MNTHTNSKRQEDTSQSHESKKGVLLRKLFLGVALTLTAPLGYAANIPVNCNAAGVDLHTIIAAAAANDVLQISGTCMATFAIAPRVAGSFTLNVPLTLEQDPSSTVPAVLDGGNTFPVLSVTNNAGNTLLKNLVIQNGKSNNRSESGGITNKAVLLIKHSTIKNNTTASNGGGLANANNVTVYESTFSGNHADLSGGAIANLAGSILMVSRSTISGNSGTVGGGIANHTLNNNVNTTISESIVANNTGGDIIATNPLTGGSILLVAPVLEGTVLMGPLQPNGGPTETMRPLDPAAIGKIACSVNETDQRGAPRPGVGKLASFPTTPCDIGAYETGNPQISLVIPSSGTLDFNTVLMGNSSTKIVEVQNTGNDVLVLYGFPATTSNPTSDNPNFVVASLPSSVGLPIFQAYDFNVTYTPTANGTDTGILSIKSNDSANFPLNVNLTGIGSGFVVPAIQQIQDIMALMNNNANLFGEGPGKSAANRFNAFKNMIATAGNQISNGQYADACSQLKDALIKIDVPENNTKKNNNFFVGGSDAPTLYMDIKNLIGPLGLNCS